MRCGDVGKTLVPSRYVTLNNLWSGVNIICAKLHKYRFKIASWKSSKRFSLVSGLKSSNRSVSECIIKQLISKGTKIGPLSGSEFALNGRANGSPGTARKWNPQLFAFLRHVSIYIVNKNTQFVKGPIVCSDKAVRRTIPRPTTLSGC